MIRKSEVIFVNDKIEKEFNNLDKNDELKNILAGQLKK